jgi:putative FmdB family regulatory protein
MPVYEFYCPDCHTIFNFFSRRVDTQTRPSCPQCARPDLTRQASRFAIGRHRAEGEDAGGEAGLPPGMDEERLMRAFASMGGELEGLDDNADPRQAARLMRRLFDSAGLKLGTGMAEAIRRMEAGEDPDAIDAELGDVLEQEDPFSAQAPGQTASATTADRLRQLRRDLLPAARDDHWYPLHPAAAEPLPHPS